MKTALIIGSVICCLIGLFVLFGVLVVCSESTPNHSFGMRDFLALFFDAALIFFGFAPVVMLFQSRHKEKRPFRFIFLTELFLIGLVLIALVVVWITNLI
jgi:hypothetical protein